MAGRDARKAAEQAAREVLNTRVEAVGALGLAVEQRTRAADGPAQADQKAAELLTAARAEGRRLRQNARDAIAAADAAYASGHAAAVAAGWTVDELTGLGFPPPPRRRGPTHPAVTSVDAPVSDTRSAEMAAHGHTAPG